MRYQRNLLWLVPVALATVQISTLVSAQTPAESRSPADTYEVLQEVTVTAQKRLESAQDVPIAITAFSGKTLTDLGLSSVEDIASLVPNLNVKALFGFTNPTIFLRGVGFNDFSSNAVSAVGLYRDEVYLGPTASQLLQFYDLERLEVLKGPQGTLYGRNTTGGLINMISRRPTDELRANAEVRYGRFDEVRFESGLGGPLIADKLQARVAGFYQSRDGYVLNRVTNDDLHAEQAWGARLMLDSQPADDLDLLLNVSYGETVADARTFQQRGLLPVDPSFADPATGQNGSPALCLPEFFGTPSCTDVFGYSDTDADPFAGDYNLQDKERIEALLTSARVDWRLGPATLTSVTGWIDTQRSTVEDTDSSPLELLESFFWDSDRQFTQEVRLASDGKDPLGWIVGAFYLDDRIDNDSSFDFLRFLRPFFADPVSNPTGISIPDFVFTANFPYVQDTEAWAIFSQVDFAFTEKLSATIGLRYTEEKKTIDYRSFADDEAFVFIDIERALQFSNVSGRLSLQWQPQSDLLLYASVNRGFKGGGFNGIFVTEEREIEPFGEETVDAYEIGLKYDFADSTARLNAAAFYYDYKDLQVFTFVNVVGRDPISVIENAADARIYGAELELALQPTPRLTALFSAGYLDTKYVDFRSALSGGNFSGSRLPAAPQWTLSALLRYQRALAHAAQGYAQIDASYRTKAFFNSSNTERLSEDAYGLANLRLGVQLADGRWDVALWTKNLFNKEYALDGLDFSAFGFDQVNQAEPRTYGLTVSYSY